MELPGPSATNDEFIELVLNHNGEDYRAVVPLRTANILINDPAEAELFIVEDLKKKNRQPIEPEPRPEQKIWTSRKPNSNDIDATKLFLEERLKLSSKFDDRKTIKNELWLEIATKLNKNGYYVGGGREAFEKLRLKFASLQKQYMDYKDHIKRTGEATKTEPMFFPELNEILGKKHKVDPTNLQDSDGSDNIDRDGNENISPAPEAVKNRFHTTKLKPKTGNTLLMETMRQQHDDTMKKRSEEFNSIKDLLQTQNTQRERFLTSFEKLVEHKIKKQRTDLADD